MLSLFGLRSQSGDNDGMPEWHFRKVTRQVVGDKDLIHKTQWNRPLIDPSGTILT